jgi:hypothetical protein
MRRGTRPAYGEQERALVMVGFGAVGLGGHDGGCEGLWMGGVWEEKEI